MNYESLINRIKQNDNSAIMEFYNKFYKEVYYVCYKITENEKDAEDVAQETLIKAIDKIDTLKNPEGLSAWLRAIANNLSINYLKKNRKFDIIDNSEDMGEEIFEENRIAKKTPEDIVADKEVTDILTNMINKLPREQRLTIFMFYYEELSVKEIAEIMDCSEATVRSRINYARKALRKQVDDLENKGVKLRCIAILPFLFAVYSFEKTGICAAIAMPSASALNGGIKGGAENLVKAAKLSLKAKIAIGVVATVVLLGGTVGVASLVSSDNNENNEVIEEKYDINIFQKETEKNDKGEYDVIVPEYVDSEIVFDNEHISIVTNGMTVVEDSTYEDTGYTNIVFNCTVTNKTSEKLEVRGFAGFINDLSYDGMNLGILVSNDNGFLSTENILLEPSESKKCQILIRNDYYLRRDIEKVDKVDMKVKYNNEDFSLCGDTYFTIFLCDESEYTPYSIDKENSILLYDENNNKVYLTDVYIYQDDYDSALNYLGIAIFVENNNEDIFYFKVSDTILNGVIDDVEYSSSCYALKGRKSFCHYGVNLKDINVSNLEDVKELMFKMTAGETFTNEGVSLEKCIQFK